MLLKSPNAINYLMDLISLAAKWYRDESHYLGSALGVIRGINDDSGRVSCQPHRLMLSRARWAGAGPGGGGVGARAQRGRGGPRLGRGGEVPTTVPAWVGLAVVSRT